MAPDGDVIKKQYEPEPRGDLTLPTFGLKIISIQDGAAIAENKRRICVLKCIL